MTTNEMKEFELEMAEMDKIAGGGEVHIQSEVHVIKMSKEKQLKFREKFLAATPEWQAQWKAKHADMFKLEYLKDL